MPGNRLINRKLTEIAAASQYGSIKYFRHICDEFLSERNYQQQRLA